MMDRNSEFRLKLVHPKLSALIHQLADVMLTKHGIEIRVIQGHRSWNEQHELWLKGRDAQGNVVDKHAVVTNADGGDSWHNYALAVDCAPDDPTRAGYQIDWNPEHPQWKLMEEEGRALGLFSGADFKRLVDAPHFQLTGKFPVSPNGEVKQIFKDGGTLAVWRESGIR